MKCHHPLPGGAIAGIVVGCVVFAAIILLAMFYIYKRRRNRRINHPSTTSSSTAIAPTTEEVKPTPPTVSIDTTTSPFADEFFVVVHPYLPQLKDELALNIGDIICLATQFDDGWALGFNVTSGVKGAFPIVCITSAPKDSLDRLLNMDEFASIVSEEEPDLNLQLTMEKIINSTQRSINLNSYNTDNESPISPTINTPFFDNLRKNLTEMK